MRSSLAWPRTLLPLLAALLLALATVAPALADLKPDDLPELTGRVVDAANVLPAPDRETLRQKLEALEDRTGIQFVVASVPSLKGEEIEPYANALFRKWHLGQKDKNNGLLFLIAPTERRIRFEVGYGLEGVLTDAVTKLILRNQVGPKLKANDYASGVNAGVDAVIGLLNGGSASQSGAAPSSETSRSGTALPGTTLPGVFLDGKTQAALAQSDKKQPPGDAGSPLAGLLVVLIVGGVILVIVIVLFRARRGLSWIPIIPSPGGGSWSSGSSTGDSGGGSGDSFAGGGGDSGGGGSSDSY